VDPVGIVIVILIILGLGVLADWLHERVGFWAFLIVSIIGGGLLMAAISVSTDIASRP
jgi:hypothetical protein